MSAITTSEMLNALESLDNDINNGYGRNAVAPAGNDGDVTAAIVYAEDLTDDQREQFFQGWTEAGGYTGDSDSPQPWCAPWTHHDSSITVSGSTPQEWGASWWQQCQNAVDAALAEEEAAEDED